MNGYPRQMPVRPQGELGKKVQNFIYQYNDQIGKGNFARVYKGLNLNTRYSYIYSEQPVAIKLISLDQLKSQHLQALVFEEIRVLQMMNHPNILHFIEALLSERNCYLVTEFCSEGSLDDRIKRKIPFSDQQFGRIVLDLYHGLRYLRQKGVAHRDLKPANIFLSKGRLKIADFGLAKFYRDRFKDLDIGSPQYMSPEGIILNVYSEKTDIWAFGIVLYEILHGETPFQHCESEQDLKYHVARPIPEHKWRKDLHPLLRQFINRLLEVDQNRRPNIYQLINQPFLRDLLDRENQTNKFQDSRFQTLKVPQTNQIASMRSMTLDRKSEQKQRPLSWCVNPPPPINPLEKSSQSRNLLSETNVQHVCMPVKVTNISDNQQLRQNNNRSPTTNITFDIAPSLKINYKDPQNQRPASQLTDRGYQQQRIEINFTPAKHEGEEVLVYTPSMQYLERSQHSSTMETTESQEDRRQIHHSKTRYF